MSTSKGFAAHYAGWCHDGKHWFPVGAAVRYDEYDELSCLACLGDHGRDAAMEELRRQAARDAVATPCPTCWLVGPCDCET